MRVVVIGGSAAGLFTSLLLARAGHEAVVLDRDPVQPAPDVESAAQLAFRAAVAQPGVTVRGGVQATGLLARPGSPPHVTGVRTRVGDLPADLVVDATGRRSSLDRWLTGIGSQPTATQAAECGLAYYSRHYRLRTSAGLPGPATARIVAGLDEFTVGIWGGDNATMVLCIAPLAEDKRFRGVRDPHIFTRVLRTVPTYAAWLDVLEPTSPVFPMGACTTRCAGSWWEDPRSRGGCTPSVTTCAPPTRRWGAA